VRVLFVFRGEVQEYRSGGMDDDFIARQVVDDLWRLGVDVTFSQHIIEEVVRAFDRHVPRD
jgi:hypothetical protein